MTEILQGVAWAPGTCGELVEGTRDGQPFLVTCPIAMGAQIEINREGAGKLALPAALTKTNQALTAAAATWGIPLEGLAFRRENTLPPGKGMGSSTADITAALLALARLAGRELTPAALANLALAVEPSDGIMFPGVVLFDHRWGQWLEELGAAPPFRLLVADPGGEVDTVGFNRADHLDRLNRKKEPQVRQALCLVQEGLAAGDWEKIGRGATASAWANQELLPKPDLPQMLHWAADVGALGVNVAHSGTVMGLLLPPDGHHPEEVKPFLAKRRPHWQFYCTDLIDGGLK